VESELFGHERGAFSGAANRGVGRFEQAEGGTLFLDEIGDMDLQIQPKLLKILEEKRFRRLGDVQERQLDIRLIAASHQDLNEFIRQKQFRSDLYFRINTIPLTTPALRERVEDIPMLAEYFLKRLPRDARTGGEAELSEGAMRALTGYSWPGNIRELRNVVERCMVQFDGQHLPLADMPQPSAATSLMALAFDRRWSAPELQSRYARFVYEQVHRNKAQACRILQINYRTLCNYLKASNGGGPSAVAM